MKLRVALSNFSELVVFKHTVFSATFSLISFIVAVHELFLDGVQLGAAYIIRIFILSMLALIFARNFAMGFNRLCDRDIDARNPRTWSRPSVDGRLSLFSLSFFCCLNAVFFVLTSYFINSLAFGLSFVFLLILAFYSFCKRFFAGVHFVLGLCLGLAPLAACIAVLGEIRPWSIFLSLGVVFWVGGFDLLYSLQDMDFDRKNKLFSIPCLFGERLTLVVSRFCHFLSGIFWLIFLLEAKSGFLGFIGLFLSVCMLIYQQYLVFLDFRNIPKSFFVTNGYLGFLFLIFIFIDVLVRV